MANRSLGVLTLDLVAKVQGFTGPIDKAARDLDRQTKGMSKSLDGFASSLKTIGAGIAGFVSGAAIAGFTGLAIGIKKTVDSMDELSKSAQKVGLTTEELSKLAYAGDLADVSLETLTSSLGKLTKAQAAALDTSSKTAEVFDALGIAVKNADGSLRSSGDVLGDFAEAFKDLGGSPEAVAAGFQIFGRSFQELIPLLKDGRQGIKDAGDELESFGGVISTQAGKAAEEFNDNLTRLKTQFSAIFAQIAAQLLPSLQDLSADLARVAKDGNFAANAVTVISTAMKVAVGAIDAYNGAVSRTTIALEAFVGLAKTSASVSAQVFSLGLADGTITGSIRGYVNTLKDAQSELDALGRRENAPASPFAGVTSSVSSTYDPEYQRQLALEERIKKLSLALAGNTEEKKKATKATKELTEAEKEWKDLQETFAIIEEETAGFITDRIIAQGNLDSQREESAQRVLEDIAQENELLGKTYEQQEAINALRWAGVDATSEEGKAILESINALQLRRNALEDQITVMDGVRDAAKGFVLDITQGKDAVDSLKEAFDSLFSTILEAIAQNLIEQFLGQAGSTSGGSSGDWLSSFASLLFGGGRATGGSVNSNGLYRVNENGPELLTVGGRDYLMMGNASGMVSPGVGGGGVVFNNTYINPQLNDHRSEAQRQQREAEQLRTATSRNS